MNFAPQLISDSDQAFILKSFFVLEVVGLEYFAGFDLESVTFVVVAAGDVGAGVWEGPLN